MDDGIHVRVGRLPERRVERVRLVFDRARDAEGRAVVGVDDADGAFVRLSGLPDMPDPEVCGLSADGRKLLFKSSREYDTLLTRLCLLDLPTGQEKWYELTEHAPRDSPAALSPDGNSIAVLSDVPNQDDDEPALACVDLIDVASGTRERLWTSPGEAWSSWECGLVWSPGGRLIAVTHMWFDHDESNTDWETVIVLDTATGAAVHRLDFQGHIGWLDDRDLITWTFESWAVLDTASGSSRDVDVPWEPGQSSEGPAGALNGRVIAYRGFNHAPYAYFHADAFGQDVRPLFTADASPLPLFLASDTRPLDHLGRPRP